MRALQRLGGGLILAGACGLAWGSYQFTQHVQGNRAGSTGPTPVASPWHERLDLPARAAGLSLVTGVGLLAFGRRRH
jgi:hypothetical protein